MMKICVTIIISRCYLGECLLRPSEVWLISVGFFLGQDLIHEQNQNLFEHYLIPLKPFKDKIVV